MGRSGFARCLVETSRTVYVSDQPNITLPRLRAFRNRKGRKTLSRHPCPLHLPAVRENACRVQSDVCGVASCAWRRAPATDTVRSTPRAEHDCRRPYLPPFAEEDCGSAAIFALNSQRDMPITIKGLRRLWKRLLCKRSRGDLLPSRKARPGCVKPVRMRGVP